MIYHFKPSIHIITIIRRTDKFQCFFHQRKWLFVIQILYPKYINNYCIINTTNSTKIINTIKIYYFLPLFELTMTTLLAFVSFLVHNDIIRKKSEDPFDWRTRYSWIRAVRSFSAKSSPESYSSEAKLPKHQVFA